MRVFLSICLFLLLLSCEAFASGSLGIGLSRSVDADLSLSVQGDYQNEGFHVDYNYQGMDIHDAKLNMAYRFELGKVDASVFQENDWTGYSVGKLNRHNDLGVSGIFSADDFDFEVALFGRNGNTAASVKKYDENTGEVISSTPGLSPIDGIHPNVSVSVKHTYWDVETELKALTNVVEDPTPQWLLDGSTTGDIGRFQWVLSAVYRGQYHLDKFEHEFSSILTFGTKW